MKWSQQRMCKVLNNAILTGNVGDDMIACAETALGEGFEGSLSRSDIRSLQTILTPQLVTALMEAYIAIEEG